jgi:3-phosphoshikimate 1-carboxyvinyltransferase
MSRQVVQSVRRVAGDLRVPGDKSISHRAVLIAAVGEGSCLVTGLSSGEDVASSLEVMSRLGVVSSNAQPQVEDARRSPRGSDTQILVEGRGWNGLRAPSEALDCGNSGTTARILLGILAGRPFEARLDGDDSLRSRPMGRVTEPLRRMGASFTSGDGGERLPLTVAGGELRGIEHRSPVASAQVKSSLILAALQAAGESVIEEPAPSRDHTERLLAYLGVPIDRSPNRVVVKSTNIQNASSLNIPGDLSSAAFLLVAAAILPGSEVTVHDVGLNPTRTGILDILRSFGADVRVSGEREEYGEPRGSVTVRAGDRRPVSVSGDEIVRTVDELPLVAVLGAFAEGETVIADAAELRVKESDRIATVAAGLTALGARVEATPDGLVVQGPSRLEGAEVSAAGDHRIAMALAVAGLAAGGETSIEGFSSADVSYPSFIADLDLVSEL